MRSLPTLTLQLPSGAAYDGFLMRDWPRFLDLARSLEDVGVDRLAVVDHVVMGPDATRQYVWSDRPFPPTDSVFMEPLASLASIAAVTRHVRLTTRILIAPLRPAALLAKTAASVDVICGGRLDLGVGTGWQREEYEAQGLDFADRGTLLTDTMGACRALWRGGPVRFSSGSVTLVDITCSPLPVQQRLPVWFGGTLGERNLRRVLDLGDGWIPIMTARPDDVVAGAQRLRAVAEAEGRPMPGVQLPAPVVRDDAGRPDLPRTVASLEEAIGPLISDVFFSIGELCPDPDRITANVHDLVRRFRVLA